MESQEEDIDATLPTKSSKEGRLKSTIPVLETLEACGLVDVPVVAAPEAKGKGKQEVETMIYTGGDKGQIKLWSLKTGKLVRASPASDKASEIVDIWSVPAFRRIC